MTSELAAALTRGESFTLASVADKAERFDDMVAFVRRAIEADEEGLTATERDRFAVAFKQAILSRRQAWRAVMEIKRKEEERNGQRSLQLIQWYAGQLEAEMTNICTECLRLSSTLVERTSSAEERVFLLKMSGDSSRYMAEYATGSRRQQVAEQCLTAYTAARTLAVAELPTTHPLRLGVMLNFSVFFYEILDSPEKATAIARNAFDDALRDLDTLNEDKFKESTLMLQLLRDNLNVWAADSRV